MISNNQSFLLKQFREDDIEVNVEQINQKNNNKSECFISDQSKEARIDATAKQKKKRTQNKRKTNSKVVTLYSNTHRRKYDTISMPYELESSD